MAEIAGLFLGAAALIPIFFETGDAIVTKAESNRKAKAIAENLQIFTLPESRALLKLDFLSAQAILNDAEISLEDKSNIQGIFGRGMILLREMNELTDAVLEHQGIFKSKRKRAHLKLQEKTVQLKENMGNLHHMVIVLRQIRESTATFLLEDQDFKIIRAGKHLSIANHDIFIAEGRPARKIETCEPIVSPFLFEPKPYASHHQKSIKKDMRALSRKLSAAERSVGILPIVGFREVPEDQVFQLVFALPSNRSLTATLQSIYQQTCSQPSLNTRVDLCRQLAEAVLHTHSLGLVHKNIRPENILLLSQSRQEGALELEPTLYVIGWQFARQVDGGATQLGGETLWERRVYQHPERQTERAEEEYCIGHDIYSFGVCMLEILTWDCLVPEENSSTEVEPSISQSFGKALIQLGANFESDHRPESTSEVAWITRDPRIVQSALRTMSETHVPVVAGRKLADLLIKCLTCLEPEGGFGDSLAVKGQDRKEVGLDFIDTILNDLRSVSSVI